MIVMAPGGTNSRDATRYSCPTPGCGSRQNVASTGVDAHTPMVTAAVFTVSKMEPARCLSTDERIKKTGADTTWNFIHS